MSPSQEQAPTEGVYTGKAVDRAVQPGACGGGLGVWRPDYGPIFSVQTIVIEVYGSTVKNGCYSMLHIIFHCHCSSFTTND